MRKSRDELVRELADHPMPAAPERTVPSRTVPSEKQVDIPDEALEVALQVLDAMMRCAAELEEKKRGTE